MERKINNKYTLVKRSGNNLGLFLVFIIVICLSFIFFTSTTLAQIPEPYVTCDDTRDPEWHSLRPYQASPCTAPIIQEEQALLCGNDLIADDIIHHPQDPNRCLNCLPPPCCDCTVTRDFVAPREFIIAFNAYESELPIAGNTELIPGDDSDLTLFNKEYRLGDFAAPPGWLSSLISIFKKNDMLPPDPEEIETVKDYWIEYQEWRGKTCRVIHINFLWIHKEILICYEDITEPNFWANIFPLIPYSSTEDRIGKAQVYDMVWVPEKSRVDRVEGLETDWNGGLNPKDPRHQTLKENETPLYYPHMEENVELANLLQTTYLSKDLLEEEQPIGEVEPVAIDSQCKILDVRSNPGDQLFGEKTGDLGIPNANVSYDAYYQCSVYYPPADPLTGTCWDYEKLPCTKNAWFYSDVDIYTPMVDELFSKTVSGNASVVKKVFPQIGVGTPIEKIKDIPATTAVEHQYEDVTSHVDLVSQPADFYIPHFGSIYDYFLKDMQTLLRPKGFAEEPAGLLPDSPIAEVDRANEYLSWYLNGTLYRAEQNPLDAEKNCIGETTGKAGVCSEVSGNSCMIKELFDLIPNPLASPDGQSTCMGEERQCCVPKLTGKATDMLDRDRIVNFSGPLNKLLPQSIQWRAKVAQPTGEEKISRVGQIERAVEQNPKDKRHNQIIACVFEIDVWIPFVGDLKLFGIPTACQENHLASVGQVPEGVETSEPSEPLEGICQVANAYNIPCCFLEAIWNIESGASSGGGSDCCNESERCGPMQIAGGLVEPLSAGENLNVCNIPDAWILAARLLILKKCVADGACNNWEWRDELLDQYSVSADELEIAAYYHGNQGCYPDDETESRWGEGVTYCDAVEYWCQNGEMIPDK